MNRRSLVQSLLGLPLFSWLAPAPQAPKTQFTTYAPPGGYVAHKGLAARRKEAVDAFMLAFDNCVQAEQDRAEAQGHPFNPTHMDLRLTVHYPGRIRTCSNPELNWGPFPSGSGDLYVANHGFTLGGRDGRPDLQFEHGERMLWDGEVLTTLAGDFFQAPNFKIAIAHRYVRLADMAPHKPSHAIG